MEEAARSSEIWKRLRGAARYGKGAGLERLESRWFRVCRIPVCYRELTRPIPALTLVLIVSLVTLSAFFAALTFAFIACSCMDYEGGDHNAGLHARGAALVPRSQK